MCIRDRLGVGAHGNIGGSDGGAICDLEGRVYLVQHVVMALSIPDVLLGLRVAQLAAAAGERDPHATVFHRADRHDVHP